MLPALYDSKLRGVPPTLGGQTGPDGARRRTSRVRLAGGFLFQPLPHRGDLKDRNAGVRKGLRQISIARASKTAQPACRPELGSYPSGEGDRPERSPQLLS